MSRPVVIAVIGESNPSPKMLALAEAVGLANDLSTDESGKYINGVLARIKDVKPRMSLGE